MPPKAIAVSVSDPKFRDTIRKAVRPRAGPPETPAGQPHSYSPKFGGSVNNSDSDGIDTARASERGSYGAPQFAWLVSMTNTGVLTDPSALSPSQWSARLAAFLSRGRGNDDPDVIACREALSYRRVRRSIDAEREHLAPAHVPALADMLRHAHPAVTA
jgi:hypothetical protein